MDRGSKAYFDEIGEAWDEFRKSLYPETVRDQAVAVAGARPGEVAADIGAGTGFLTEALVARGLRVVAVDQSETMLSAVGNRFAASDRVECRIGMAEELPIDDGTVHYAFANMLLHHVEVPARAIREMARILRPGGRVVITDLDTHEHEFLRREQHDRWMGFEREKVRDWLREAGLVDVEVGCAGADCCTKSGAGQGIAVSIFLASGRKPEATESRPSCC